MHEGDWKIAYPCSAIGVEQENDLIIETGSNSPNYEFAGGTKRTEFSKENFGFPDEF